MKQAEWNVGDIFEHTGVVYEIMQIINSDAWGDRYRIYDFKHSREDGYSTTLFQDEMEYSRKLTPEEVFRFKVGM